MIKICYGFILAYNQDINLREIKIKYHLQLEEIYYNNGIILGITLFDYDCKNTPARFYEADVNISIDTLVVFKNLLAEYDIKCLGLGKWIVETI